MIISKYMIQNKQEVLRLYKQMIEDDVKLTGERIIYVDIVMESEHLVITVGGLKSAEQHIKDFCMNLGMTYKAIKVY